MTITLMANEATEAGQKICEQLEKNKPLLQQIATKLQQIKPKMVMIVGRGSSDHAGVFAKYLIEIETGIPTFAAAPSITSVYNKSLNLQDALVIIISQSGRSPDILAQAKQAKENGAFCIALLNDESAPLANLVDCVVPLFAGEEKSVAATKSYLATLSATLQLVAFWSQNEELITALDSIPNTLQEAVNSPTQLLNVDLLNIEHLVVLGRGLGYAISKEIALKLKEVCAIHAEAFSSAEFLHGPVALVESGLKIIEIVIDDESATNHIQQVAELKSRGADLVHLYAENNNVHPRIAALAVLQRFYLDIERIAVERGLNPDEPGGLKKVTRTL